MAYNESIVEDLSQFNNLSFTKKQWEIILKGCGCPKSCHFWSALKQHNIIKNKRTYTLIDINPESFNIIWETYCNTNRINVRKSYQKAQAKKKAEERKRQFKGITFYMVGGILTTEKPERDL